MKQLYLLTAMLTVFTIGSLSSQSWTNLGPLFNILTEDQENDFEFDLGELSDDLTTDPFDGLRVSDFQFDLAQDSFFHYFNNTPIETTDSLNGFWDMNEGELNAFYENTDLSPEDSLTVAGDFFRVDSLWNVEFDSLNTEILSYQDSLGTLDSDIIGGYFIRFDVSQGKLVQQLHSLENNYFPSLLEDNENIGIDNIGEALDSTLFRSALDIEMAFGQEWSSVRFYNESYDVRANLVRIASVPRFDQSFEFRWALEGSFFNNDENLFNDEQQSLDPGANPFICHADGGVTYTPMLSCFNGGIFRLYTSLGMEVATYVPSHRIENHPRFGDRVGKTTGFGPQIGLGFTVQRAGMLFYSYGTVSRGDVVSSEAGYDFNAMTVSAGARFGDAVNLRYTFGDYSWARQDNKSAVFSRFTVGIILDELNR